MRTDAGETTVEAWIEPISGQWRKVGPGNKSELDLGIVAVHGALVAKGGKPEMVM